MNLTLVFAAAFVVTLCGLVVVTAGLRQSERDRTRLLAANARLAATDLLVEVHEDGLVTLATRPVLADGWTTWSPPVPLAAEPVGRAS